MQFRTVLKPQKSTFEIGYELPTLAFGSCFAENIGKRLSAIQMPILINPFGILYNSISIVKNINYLMTDNFYTENDIFQHDGLWHSKNHHGRFSSPQKAEILRGINDDILKARNFLKETKRLIITLGTAHVFVEKSTGEVVANCHKLPPQYFDKKRLSVVEIVENLKPIIEKLNAQLIDLEIIITVSPIRHLRDGFIENQKSKATLLLATEQICNDFPNVHYFPAYEIMMDDLRDYRFYEADMIHPNQQAIDYIEAFFRETFFTEKTQKIAFEVEKINAMLQHRPLHNDTDGYQLFAHNLKIKVQEMENKYPFLKF